MATQEQLYTALRNADAAGDTAAARRIAAYIQQQSAAPVAPPVDHRARLAQAEAEQAAEAAKGGPSVLAAIGRGVAGAGETVLNLGTQAVATPIAGIAGLGASVFGSEGAGARTVESVSNAMTYQPRGEVGKAAQKTIAYLPGKLAAGADRAGEFAAELTGSPAVGSAVNTGINMLPSLLLKGSPKKTSILPTAEADISRGAQVNAARAAGYKLPPRMAGGKVGSVAEGISGSAKLERTLSERNQKVTQKLARKEIGLEGNKPISGAELEVLRKKHNKAYDDISKSGRVMADEQFARDMFSVGGRTEKLMKDFPEAASAAVEKLRNAYIQESFDASSAVQATRQLRADARKLLKAFDDPEKQALGMASREIADAFDGVLQRHAEGLGKPQLAENFRSARQQLAKIHSVENALNESTGHVIAQVLGRDLDRGLPLSGGLKTIAETARRFGKAVQDVDKMPARGIGFEDVLGGGAVGLTLLDPLSGMGATVARPLMRQALASDFIYQNMLSRGGRLNTLTDARSLGAGGVAAQQVPARERATR